MQREKRKASKGVEELIAGQSDDFEDVQPAPKVPKKSDKVEKVRVWWPPTKDKERTGFSGAYWPASVLKKGSNFLKVEYDNGESENVDPDNIFPFDVPIEFGNETVPLMAGEFVEVSNNSKTDPCAWLGKIATIGKKCLIDYPFHDSPSEYIKLDLLRRARVWDDLDWKYIELGQKWKAGEVTSPIELNLVLEEDYYKSLKQAGSSGKSSKSKRAAADAASDDAESAEEGSSPEDEPEPQPQKQRGRSRKPQHPSRAVLDDNNSTEHKDEKPKGAKKRKPAAVRQAPNQEEVGKHVQLQQQQQQQRKQSKFVALSDLVASTADKQADSKAEAAAAAADWKPTLAAAKAKKAQAAKDKKTDSTGAKDSKGGGAATIRKAEAAHAGTPAEKPAAGTSTPSTRNKAASGEAAASTAAGTSTPNTRNKAASGDAAAQTAAGTSTPNNRNKAATGEAAAQTAAGTSTPNTRNKAASGDAAAQPAAGASTPNTRNKAASGKATAQTAAGISTLNTRNKAASGDAAAQTAAGTSTPNTRNKAASGKATAQPAARASTPISSTKAASGEFTAAAGAPAGSAAAPVTLTELMQGLDQPVLLLPAAVGNTQQSPMMLLLPKGTTSAGATDAFGRMALSAAAAAGWVGPAGGSGLKGPGSGISGGRKASGRSSAVPPVPAFVVGSADAGTHTPAPQIVQILGLPPGTSAAATTAELEIQLAQLKLTEARLALAELYTSEAYLLLVDCWRADSPKLADALRSFKANVAGLPKPDYQAFMVGVFGIDKMKSLELAK